jgi:hypothetical protein
MIHLVGCHFSTKEITMKTKFKTMWLHCLALLFVVSVAHAQPAQPAQSDFSQPELEQMLAPIALYPDALLSQILMASTYPTEVVAASYWLKANPGISGNAAVEAAKNEPWDISVKSLLPFPQVLSTMESKQDWTQNLGNAFLGQEKQVMDTIQLLRQKAMAAGYLKSDTRIRVDVQDRLVSISLIQPTVVYVPYYNPMVVYGTWWAPAYAPIYWDPWPGYVVYPGYHGWAWGAVGTVVVVGILYGAFSWHHHHVLYGGHMGYWRGHSGFRPGSGRWIHDPRHRHDVLYRHGSVDKRFGHIARAHNAKHPPLRTQDIRTGKHTFKPVSTKTAVGGKPNLRTKTGVSANTTKLRTKTASTTVRKTGVSGTTGAKIRSTTTTTKIHKTGGTGGASVKSTVRTTSSVKSTGAGTKTLHTAPKASIKKHNN